jgi:hypothetical protein
MPLKFTVGRWSPSFCKTFLLVALPALRGGTMLPGQALDLDHTADGAGYRGFAHASCNRREGARRGNAPRRPRGGVFAP